jgi:hypothetical protein
MYISKYSKIANNTRTCASLQSNYHACRVSYFQLTVLYTVYSTTVIQILELYFHSYSLTSLYWKNTIPTFCNAGIS